MVWEEEVRAKRRELGLDDVNAENSKRNDEIIKRNLEKQLERKMKILENQVSLASLHNGSCTIGMLSSKNGLEKYSRSLNTSNGSLP